jgi:hypothetical protein
VAASSELEEGGADASGAETFRGLISAISFGSMDDPVIALLWLASLVLGLASES